MPRQIFAVHEPNIQQLRFVRVICDTHHSHPFEIAEKLRRTLPTSGWLVFVEHNRILGIHARSVEPHIALALCYPNSLP
jgi:hypothetical protein